MNNVVLLLLTALLFLLIQIYFRIADRFNIIDKPNERSSHTEVTIRGGGVIFPIAMLLYALYFDDISKALLVGMIAIGLVSFLDDVYTLPNRIRIVVHLFAVSTLFYAVDAYTFWPIWLIVLGYVLVIGAINAYNFMDGINGITGLYSLIILSSLLYLNTTFKYTDSNFILIAILASLVFLFFNFRKKARCFAGDVGSVSMAFWVIALIVLAIARIHELKYILFISVYGVDAVLTIVHRLILKQNIFSAHRLHFYQILANERKVPQLYVSALYAGLQLIINFIVIFAQLDFIVLFLLINVPLVVVYIALKGKLMHKG